MPGFQWVLFSARLCWCDIKNFCRNVQLVPQDARTAPNRTRGRKARREGGGNSNSPSDEQLIRSVFEHDEQLDRARLNTTNPLHPQEGGSTTLQCQRTAARFKHGGEKPEWGSPQNACILWGPGVGGGYQDNPRDEKFDRASLSTTNNLSECFCAPPRSRRGEKVRRTVFGGS